jgi:hypothetical protein
VARLVDAHLMHSRAGAFETGVSTGAKRETDLETDLISDHIQEAACTQRLQQLRRLVSDGSLRDAVELSFALRDRRGLSHPACFADEPHIGEGSIVTKVATPDRRTRPLYSSFLTPHSNSGESSVVAEASLRLLSATAATTPQSRNSVLRSATRVPVVGFALDGEFVLSESPLRCHAPTSEDGGLVCDGGLDIRGVHVADAAEAVRTLVPTLTSARSHKAAIKRRRDGITRDELLAAARGLSSFATRVPATPCDKFGVLPLYASNTSLAHDDWTSKWSGDANR